MECSCIYCPLTALNVQLCDVLVCYNPNGGLSCRLPKKGLESYNEEQKKTIANLMVRAVIMGEKMYGRDPTGDYSNSHCALYIQKVGKKVYKLCVHAKSPE